MISPTEYTSRKAKLSRGKSKMSKTHPLLDAATMSIFPIKDVTSAQRPDAARTIEEGLSETMKSLNATLKLFDSPNKSITADTASRSTKSSGISSKRKSSRSQKRSDTLASDPYSVHASAASTAASKSCPGSISERLSYSGVRLNGIVGSLTLAADRLTFKRRDPRGVKDHVFTWQLDALLKHQISGPNATSCQLRLVSQCHPFKVADMTFPDRASLESIHAQLSSKLQPLRKCRKLKETLLSTQRKLKEANRDIDELQDANQKLLDSCEAFGRKCKFLSGELQEQQQKQIQRFVLKDKVEELEEKLRMVGPELETLRNEKTAMAIGNEMDTEGYKNRIKVLELELAEERDALEEERAVTERLLDEREYADELQLEVKVLARELTNERRRARELKSKLELQENESDVNRKIRQQRNNAYLELRHARKERDNLQHQLNEYQARRDSPEEQEVREQDPEGEQSSDPEQLSVVTRDCNAAAGETSSWSLDRGSTTTTTRNQHWACLGGYLPLLCQPKAIVLRSSPHLRSCHDTLGSSCESGGSLVTPDDYMPTRAVLSWITSDEQSRTPTSRLLENRATLVRGLLRTVVIDPTVRWPLIHTNRLAGLMVTPMTGFIHGDRSEEWSQWGSPRGRPMITGGLKMCPLGRANGFWWGWSGQHHLQNDVVSVILSSPCLVARNSVADPMGTGRPWQVSPAGTTDQDQRKHPQTRGGTLRSETVASWPWMAQDRRAPFLSRGSYRIAF